MRFLSANQQRLHMPSSSCPAERLAYLSILAPSAERWWHNSELFMFLENEPNIVWACTTVFLENIAKPFLLKE